MVRSARIDQVGWPVIGVHAGIGSGTAEEVGKEG
jgi:hypothetical protein